MTATLKLKINFSKATIGPHAGLTSVKWGTWHFITAHCSYVSSPSAVLFSLYCFQTTAVANVATPEVFSRGIKLSATKTKGFLSELNGAIGQMNGNTTDTVHTSLLIWC
jgi:hypothetical protein